MSSQHPVASVHTAFANNINLFSFSLARFDSARASRDTGKWGPHVKCACAFMRNISVHFCARVLGVLGAVACRKIVTGTFLFPMANFSSIFILFFSWFISVQSACISDSKQICESLPTHINIVFLQRLFSLQFKQYLLPFCSQDSACIWTRFKVSHGAHTNRYKFRLVSVQCTMKMEIYLHKNPIKMKTFMNVYRKARWTYHVNARMCRYNFTIIFLLIRRLFIFA